MKFTSLNRQQVNKKEKEDNLKMERQSYLSKYWRWISIVDEGSAVKVSRQGFWAASIIAAFMIVLFLFRIAEQPYDELASGLLVRSIVFGATAWEIYRMSRIASILGLVFHFYFDLYPSFTLWLKSFLDLNSAIVVVVLTLMFINGMRGTVAYHRYRKVT